MRSFGIILCLALAWGNSLAADWADSGIKVDVKTAACYADKFLYGLMKKGGDAYGSCQQSRGNYPVKSQGTMGVYYCLFNKLGYLYEDGMKIDWNKLQKDFGTYGKFVTDCKNTDYDTDGGFFDTIGDWFGGEDFDYSSVDRSIKSFYSCVVTKMANEADSKFKSKFSAVCPAR